MNLAVWFSNYFANNIKEEDKDFVVTELKKAILTLNSAVGKFPSSIHISQNGCFL